MNQLVKLLPSSHRSCYHMLAGIMNQSRDLIACLRVLSTLMKLVHVLCDEIVNGRVERRRLHCDDVM